MTIRKEVSGGYELVSSDCPKCQAPTLDQTSNREDCVNCGYWLIYATGEGWGGYRDEEK